MRRTRPLILLGRLAAGILVVIAAGALAGITAGRTRGAAAAAASYGYCDTSASSVYYCPPPNNPPDCSTVTVSPATLWSPNHGLVLVTLSGGTDPDGDPVTITVTGVTQDEPLNGTGDGDTAPDALPGPTASSVRLRAERAGGGNGRVYRISFTGSDGAGGTCAGSVTVTVPRDQSKAAVDSRPPSVDSFGP